MSFSRVLQFLTYIIAWLLLSASGLWFFMVLRATIFDLGVLFKLNPWAVGGIVRWGTFAFGLIWVVLIFTVEGYLRTSIEKNKFWPRLRRVLLIVAVAAVLVQTSRWFINYIL